MLNEVFAACLLMASQTYSIPPAVMAGIYQVEGGKVGQQVGNKNGSYDLGPMQINTIWLPELARMWGISQQQAWKEVRDNPCKNAAVAAWILKGHLNETKNLPQAIAHYHSRTPHIGQRYRKKVILAMHKKGLVKNKR